MGGPARVHPGPLLAVGLGCVDGPKQLQPVALCLSRDGGPPLEFVGIYEHLTLPRGTPGSDPTFVERRHGEVGLSTGPMGEDFSGSCIVTSRNSLLHNGATTATKSERFDAEGVPLCCSRVLGDVPNGLLATVNFVEFH